MPTAYHGLLVLDKPTGITSRDAVNRAQTWFPRGTRIGHTGTLDPLATGVLVLCIGSATRLTEYVQRMSKVYSAHITLGATRRALSVRLKTSNLILSRCARWRKARSRGA